MDGSATAIPPELSNFFELPGPQSLLIRGPPGSGKTTLALALLDAFPGQRFYITGRVRDSDLLRAFPWLGVTRSRQNWNLLDLASSPRSASEAARLSSLISESVPEGTGDGQRQRLWLPGAIHEVWARRNRTAPTMMVLDSWNAFTELYLGLGGSLPVGAPSREDLERYLLDLVGTENVHTVLVLEGEAQTQLDYLVDGVATTQVERPDGHRERWLSFPKLRGVRIETDEYPFTLDGSRFRAFPRTQPTELVPQAPEAERPRTKGAVWPGSSDFVAAFGRLPFDALTLIELDPGVPRQVHRAILFPIMSDVMRRGGRVPLVPPPTLDPQDTFDRLSQMIPLRDLKRRLRVLGLVENAALMKDHREIFVSTPLPRGPIFPTNPDGKGPPDLLVTYLSGIEALMAASGGGARLGRALIPGMARMVFGPKNIHMIAVGRGDDSSFQELTVVAGVHIGVHDRRGRIVLSGKRPFTPEYVLERSRDARTPYELTRLV